MEIKLLCMWLNQYCKYSFMRIFASVYKQVPHSMVHMDSLTLWCSCVNTVYDSDWYQTLHGGCTNLKEYTQLEQWCTLTIYTGSIYLYQFKLYLESNFANGALFLHKLLTLYFCFGLMERN